MQGQYGSNGLDGEVRTPGYVEESPINSATMMFSWITEVTGMVRLLLIPVAAVNLT
jgi:hypothetical protein